jgi:hypothetical protein
MSHNAHTSLKCLFGLSKRTIEKAVIHMKEMYISFVKDSLFFLHFFD